MKKIISKFIGFKEANPGRGLAGGLDHLLPRYSISLYTNNFRTPFIDGSRSNLIYTKVKDEINIHR